MEVRRAEKSDFEQLCLFNERMYPNKATNAREYISFWLSKSPVEINENIVVVDESGIIYGQNLFSTSSYFHDGEVRHVVWGFDLIVDPAIRDGSWGPDLMMFGKRMKREGMSTGANPPAVKLNLKLGSKYAGEIRKYVGLVGLKGVVSSFFKGLVSFDRYPGKIIVGTKVFELISKDRLPDNTLPYNKDIVEICRDKDFLKWRFFNDLHYYAFYFCAENNNYFVVRTTVKKHITMMVLVDYRCDVENEDQLDTIIKAVKKVAYTIGVPYLFCGSSLSSMDSVLEKHHLKSVGRPRPILVSKKMTLNQEAIETRNFIFVTLADSDGETSMK